MATTHTQECLKRTAECEAATSAWVKQWPNYCPVCQGHGQFESRYDPSAGGVSLGSGYMVDIEPCAICTEQGICARCGKKELAEEDSAGPCRECSWNYDDGLPTQHECYCWEEEYYRSSISYNVAEFDLF